MSNASREWVEAMSQARFNALKEAAQIADEIAAGFDAIKSEQATNVAINIRGVACAILVASKAQDREG